MDSSKLLRYTYRTSTQPPEKNISQARKFQEYTEMLNRLNLQNQSLSVNMIALINQNKILKQQLYQRRVGELLPKQAYSELRTPTRYSRSNYKTNDVDRSCIRHSQIQFISKNHSVYLLDSKNKQTSVLKAPTMIEELSEQKFAKKRGLYLSKQISQDLEVKTQQNLQLSNKYKYSYEQKINPQSTQKKVEKTNDKQDWIKKTTNSNKKTNSPYKVHPKRANCNKYMNYLQSRKDRLELMYSYLYSPIKTYNQTIYDRS